MCAKKKETSPTVKKVIEEAIGTLPRPWALLMETSADRFSETNLDVIKTLCETGYMVVFVSTVRSLRSLEVIFKERGIDGKKVFVIDCVSGKGNGKDTNIKYLDSQSLTHLSIAIKEVAEFTAGERVLFIDSIPVLLIHHQPAALARFVHDLFTVMRMKHVNCFIVLPVEITDHDMRAEIAQLSDMVIKA